MARVALLIALAAAAITAPARAAETGFNDNAVAQRIVTPDAQAQATAQLGATVHRYTLDWRGVEPQPGQYRFDLYDAIYAADVARGIKPLIILLFAPPWTWEPGAVCPPGASCAYPPGPAHLADWRRLVDTVIERYPRIAGIEVWNEPNLPFFWRPAPDPVRYAALVDNAYVSARGRTPVLAGSLANAFAAGVSSTVTAPDFLAGMESVHPRYDALSIHPYPSGPDLAPTYKMLADIRETYTGPMWLTEMGATTTGNYATFATTGQQAGLIRRLVTDLGQLPRVEAVLGHTLREPPVQSFDAERGFGIQELGGAPKPAYCALAAPRTTACPTTPRTGTSPEQQELWDAQASVGRAMLDAQAYARRHGSYEGLDARALKAPEADPARKPGPETDPNALAVFVEGFVLICASSRADLSYCAARGPDGRWVLGSAEGPIFAAAGAVTQGVSQGW